MLHLLRSRVSARYSCSTHGGRASTVQYGIGSPERNRPMSGLQSNGGGETVKAFQFMGKDGSKVRTVIAQNADWQVGKAPRLAARTNPCLRCRLNGSDGRGRA